MGDVSRGSEGPLIATLVSRSLALFKALTSTLQDDHARASQASTLVASGGSIPDTTSEGHDPAEDDLADYFNQDEDSDKSEVERILDEISHVVDCLLRLSVTIRNPAPHDQFLSRAGEGVVKSFVYWDAKHVRDKFTNVDADLANRLGRAMARRRQYFKYREEHKSRLAEGLDEDEVEFGERATTIASSLPEHLKQKFEGTEAGDAQFAILDDSRSDASGTTYATLSPDSTRLRVPPIPKAHSEGSFKCPFCHMIVSIDTRHAWKKHVFRDLRPYVCLSQACPTPDHLYLRRSDWATHMKREHWKAWYCPFGCPEEFDSAKGFQNHIKTAHKHDVSPENIHMLENLSSRPDGAKAGGQCPLCCDLLVGSEKHYEKHVGQHLEDLALFTLPDIGEDGSEDDEEDEEKEEEDVDEEDEDEHRHATDESGSRSNEESRDSDLENLNWGMLEVREELENLRAVRAAKAEAEAEALLTLDSAAALATLEEVMTTLGEEKRKAPEAEETVEAAEAETVAKLQEEKRKTVKAVEAGRKAAEETIQRIREAEEARLKEAKKLLDKLPIRFKDAGMEDLIKQAFAQVDVLGPHVMDGHYDLWGPDGEIILPAVWEKVIRPGWSISMTMWPMDNLPSLRVLEPGKGVGIPMKSPPGWEDAAGRGIPRPIIVTVPGPSDSYADAGNPALDSAAGKSATEE
ncbi:hypothetical protein ACJ41O_015116 [Fusarium nematophilum]